jgi:uncharacterized protein with HEPN domain
MPRKTPRANLEELQESASFLLSRTNGLSAEQLEDDYELSLIVERLFERIGETTRRLSLQDADLVARIPDYRQAIDMRNIIAHAYYHLNWDRVRYTLDNSVPELLTSVEEILGEFPPVEETE